MSTIVVVIRDPQPSAELIKKIRDATNQPISEIRAALTSGTPLLKSKLLFNDHEERAEELRKLVQAVADAGVSTEAFEMEEDEEYVEGACGDNRFDFPEVLDILAEWDRRVERIHDLDDKRGGP